MDDTREPWFGAPTLPPTAGIATPEWIACAGCGGRWTGLGVCHCSGCHRTFTGISAFDQHRLGGHCENPASRGLVPIARRYWSGWGKPGEDPRFTDD
jgi:hypothetical protein